MRLSIAAEFRDSTTYNHLIRMSLYSYLIAKEMGFDEEWCEKLKLAAPMHDIGKLGIKDMILLKPAKLTDEEFEEMKKHTIYGYEILKDSTIDILKMASNVALCHHEKYDGTGYPRGLKGEEIPIEARIVAVADVFDALTSRRPYKEPYEIERAVEIIEKDSGKHFDPKVVQAFKKALPEIIKILKKYGVE
jgi:HD-GYP domain-containing protein (c-di-GMP phosphodiesterase class II)